MSVMCFVCIAGSAMAYDITLPKGFGFSDGEIKKQFRSEAMLIALKKIPHMSVQKFGKIHVLAFDRIYDSSLEGDLYLYVLEMKTDAVYKKTGKRNDITWLYYAYAGKKGDITSIKTRIIRATLDDPNPKDRLANREGYAKYRKLFVKYVKAKSDVYNASNDLAREVNAGLRGVFSQKSHATNSSDGTFSIARALGK